MSNNHLITNKKERHRVFYSLTILILMAALVAFLIIQSYAGLNIVNVRALRGLRGITGLAAAAAFSIAVGMYVVRRVVKRISAKEIKQKFLALARILREWHVPISIIGFAIVLLHTYIALSRGFRFEARYISGIAALGILAIQMLSGIFRYKRIGVKFHMIMGILFITSMCIHLIS